MHPWSFLCERLRNVTFDDLMHDSALCRCARFLDFDVEATLRAWIDLAKAWHQDEGSLVGAHTVCNTCSGKGHSHAKNSARKDKRAVRHAVGLFSATPAGVDPKIVAQLLVLLGNRDNSMAPGTGRLCHEAYVDTGCRGATFLNYIRELSRG